MLNIYFNCFDKLEWINRLQFMVVEHKKKFPSYLIQRRHTVALRALSKLREDGLFGNDMVILLDEMHLQQQVQFDGQDIIGCDENLQMFKSILCFMAMSLTNTVPFVIKAIPISKLSSEIVSNGILNCIENLSHAKFYPRAVISDNHRTNISSFNYLMNMYPTEKKFCMLNPFTSQTVYLMFDTVHLIKNIRNNLLGARFFQIPQLQLEIQELTHIVPAGNVHWSSLHKVHNADLSINFHLRKAPSLNYQSLHPGNSKQSVPLALAIFDNKTSAAMREYLKDADTVTPAFLELINMWWLLVNTKERFHPHRFGNAITPDTLKAKCIFLSEMNKWLTTWKDSKKMGLTKQTFEALINTNSAIADLSNDLIRNGFHYILTGRLQTDPLERRFSQYRQMSGGRFLVSLTEILRSEKIITYQILLKRDIDYSELTVSLTDDRNLTLEFISTLPTDFIYLLTLSENTKHIVAYVSGYISHKLIQRCICETCLELLRKDQMNNSYIEILNRGGLQLPSFLLYQYVEIAFCVLESFESQILASTLPTKIVMILLLEQVSVEWDSGFVCDIHATDYCMKVRSIVANLYLSGLSKEVSENTRKSQVDSFKARKRKLHD